MFTINVDQPLLDSRADLVGATDAQIEAARTAALREMRKRIETHIKRRAAKALKISQKSLEGRFHSSSVEPGDEELQVWVGTWNVSPYAIGSPRVYGVPGKSGGVKVGSRLHPGAFLAKIYSGQENVWIRLYSQHYNPELYPTKYRPGDRGASELRGRFPVVRASVPIDAVVQDVIMQDGELLAKEFEKVFLQQLNYQVNVKGGQA